MSKSEDPFYSVRDSVNAQIERIKLRNEKFFDLLRNTDTFNNPECKEVRSKLVKDLRAADKDLKGLRGAVEMIEKNRSKFVHIKDSELNSRKKFVDDASKIIKDIKEGLDSVAVRRKIEEDENKNKRDSFADETTNVLSKQREKENSRFVKDQVQQTHQLIERQDKDVELLGQNVDRLGEIARNINQEVKEQNVMLDHLEQEVDHASDKMNTVQGALEKLLKTKDGCQIWTIVILAGILILLVCLVIWT